MANESATIVQRLWNYCNVLRDDGVSYGDYVEQLTYLLFLKMDEERVQDWGEASGGSFGAGSWCQSLKGQSCLWSVCGFLTGCLRQGPPGLGFSKS